MMMTMIYKDKLRQTMTNPQVLRDLLLPSNPLAHLMLLTPSSPSMSPLAALNSSNMNMASLPSTPTSGQSNAQIWKGWMARIKPLHVLT